MIAPAASLAADPERRLNPAVEEFLQALAALGGVATTVTTSDLAHALTVRDPSVTTMAKRLHTLGLVHHAPYHGIRLTPTGARVARQVARRHQLLERALGLNPRPYPRRGPYRGRAPRACRRPLPRVPPPHPRHHTPSLAPTPHSEP